MSLLKWALIFLVVSIIAAIFGFNRYIVRKCRYRAHPLLRFRSHLHRVARAWVLYGPTNLAGIAAALPNLRLHEERTCFW